MLAAGGAFAQVYDVGEVERWVTLPVTVSVHAQDKQKKVVTWTVCSAQVQHVLEPPLSREAHRAKSMAVYTT